MNSFRKQNGKINLKAFKIVYIAPMKALVSEIKGGFERRLREAYGMNVQELTGDINLSKSQIDDT